MKTLRLVAYLAILTSSAPVLAEPDPSPIFSDSFSTPNPAIAGREVDLALTWDGCGGWDDPPNIQILGNQITITFLYNTFCAVPIGPYLLAFPLGHFSAGEYDVVYRSQNTFVGFDPNPDQHLQLVVSPISTVPANSFWSLAGLALLICGCAGLTIRSSGPPVSVFR
jgi:hypothetical protein